MKFDDLIEIFENLTTILQNSQHDSASFKKIDVTTKIIQKTEFSKINILTKKMRFYMMQGDPLEKYISELIEDLLAIKQSNKYIKSLDNTEIELSFDSIN